MLAGRFFTPEPPGKPIDIAKLPSEIFLPIYTLANSLWKGTFAYNFYKEIEKCSRKFTKKKKQANAYYDPTLKKKE